MDTHISERGQVPSVAQFNDTNGVLNNMQNNNNGNIDKVEFDMMQALLDKTND
jgi:hypothetical protein